MVEVVAKVGKSLENESKYLIALVVAVFTAVRSNGYVDKYRSLRIAAPDSHQLTGGTEQVAFLMRCVQLHFPSIGILRRSRVVAVANPLITR